MDQLWASSSSTLTRPIRKSAESVHHLSLYRRNRSYSKNERSQSFSFEQKVPNTISCAYPALLSNVAEAFKESIIVGTRVKDNIIYHDVFDGKDAVVNFFFFHVKRLCNLQHYRTSFALFSEHQIETWQN